MVRLVQSLFCNVIIADVHSATKNSTYALLWTVCKALKGPIVAIVFPRLCFIVFTFCQPFLVSATLNWSEQDTSDDVDQGYGLIGAWFLVYVGMAVSKQIYSP